jgi:hypothetical protein
MWLRAGGIAGQGLDEVHPFGLRESHDHAVKAAQVGGDACWSRKKIRSAGGLQKRQGVVSGLGMVRPWERVVRDIICDAARPV